MASPRPLDVSREDKRSGHGAVAIPIVVVGGLVTEALGEQRAHPQEPDVAYHRPRVLLGGCQSGDRDPGVNDVAVSTALQQRLHQNAGRRSADKP
jgi:hypothetical protein